MRQRKRRRNSSFARRGWLLAGILLASGSVSYRAVRTHLRLTRGGERTEWAQAFETTADAPVRAALQRPPARPVYPYSVIRGGVYSTAEFNAAIKQDAVAAAHYAGFHRESLAMVRARHAVEMYASYRMGDVVYWTRHRVHVAAGEALVTDGANLVRARCGNRLSDTPQEPVTRMEPMEREMETPVAGNSSEWLAGDAPALDSLLTANRPAAPGSALAFEVFPVEQMLESATGRTPAPPSGLSPVAIFSWPVLPPTEVSTPIHPQPGQGGPYIPQAPGTTAQPQGFTEIFPKIPGVTPPVFPGTIAGTATSLPVWPGGNGTSWINPQPPPTTTSQPAPGSPPLGSPPLSGGGLGPEPEPVIDTTDAAVPPPKIVPEPVTGALVCAGLVLLWIAAKRFSPSSR